MFQTKLNLTDTPKREYNGWSDWTTWNCASMDWTMMQGLYECSKRLCRDYPEFLQYIHGVF